MSSIAITTPAAGSSTVDDEALAVDERSVLAQPVFWLGGAACVALWTVVSIGLFRL